MSRRKSRVEAWDTTAFANYFYWFAETCSQSDYERLIKEMLEFHQVRRHYPQSPMPSCVEYAKIALGRQDYTWVGERRNWVWERGDWRLFVNNVQGYSFEVREGISLERALAAWNDCRARLGAHDLYPAGTRVYAYRDNEPGTSRGPDPRNPGHYFLDLDCGDKPSTHLDNIVKAE